MKKVLGPELSKLILRTVEVYNQYRSPEATAKLLKLEEEGFTIEFEGLSVKVAVFKTILKTLSTN
ncbi:MAG: hypothetical protein AOA66_1373 [Candidatus Bathyarchaeota archaeon BA2]|nr:MAG: hypothetical protein AOA66_1373 [Candidatus Bathyarchaeota archaeon BA2]